MTPDAASRCIFPLIVEELAEAGAGPRRAKFLAEAALMARTVAASASPPPPAMGKAVEALARELHGFRHMSLGDNSLRASDLIYPYAALSGLIPASRFYEVRLDDFARRGMQDPDRPPYRACEDQFILYMAGRADPPAFCDGRWRRFVRRVYDFDAEHCYWFTHRYLYASDMGAADIGLDWVAPAMLLIAAKAVRWDHLDLFYEAAFCALSAGASPEWVSAIDAWSEALLPRLLAQAADSRMEVYHELFLYHLFRMRRRALAVHAPPDGALGRATTDFVEALTSKAPDRIAAAYLRLPACGRHPLFAEICLEKLGWLRLWARSGSLFDNEMMRSTAEAEPGLYEAYAKRVLAAADTIDRRPRS